MLAGDSGQRERQWSRFPPGQSASGVVVGPLGVVVGAGPEILIGIRSCSSEVVMKLLSLSLY